MSFLRRHRRQVLFLDFSLIFNYFYLPYQSSERRALVVISPPTPLSAQLPPLI